MNQQEVCVYLSAEELKSCEHHAKGIVDFYTSLYGKAGSGQYQHNTVSSNILGIKCEKAVHRWLHANGIPFTEYSSMYSNQPCDLCVGQYAFEVKGLRFAQWHKFKRMIPPNQLQRYIKKGALVLWAVSDTDTTSNRVILKGWNYAQDVQDKGVFIKTICDNVWLADDSDMRSMASLLELLQH